MSKGKEGLGMKRKRKAVAVPANQLAVYEGYIHTLGRSKAWALAPGLGMGVDDFVAELRVAAWLALRRLGNQFWMRTQRQESAYVTTAVRNKLETLGRASSVRPGLVLLDEVPDNQLAPDRNIEFRIALSRISDEARATLAVLLDAGNVRAAAKQCGASKSLMQTRAVAARRELAQHL
jgi:DNA-directed RNA polymerase specialized sigma24 family protein